MPKVTTIPATKDRFTSLPTQSFTKRRVAGYARVSTDSDEQFTSYEAQIDYYTQYIKRHADWEFVTVYTDEGISGLATKNRNGFNNMISDALNGKIDLIVTKSVSRFARNTVDSLTTIRKLKEHGVECFFEKENIFTFDGKGELLLTIMSSLAQEESRSISENVTWGQRKRFSDGKFSVAYSQFLGYDKGENGIFKINEEQAVTIRLIYKMYLEGKTTQGICNYLMDHNILSPAGKKLWRTSTVMSILQNEKYKGDALLQKQYTADFLTKELRDNHGEVQQYYVQGAHEPIIEPEQFDIVQDEIARRKKLGRAYSDKAFHSKIICGDCGSFYGRKVWHSTDKYKQIIFQCNAKYTEQKHCETPKFSEEEIKGKFLAALTQLLGDRKNLLSDCKLIFDTLCDTTELDTAIAQEQNNMNLYAEMMKTLIAKNSSSFQSKQDFIIEAQQIEDNYNRAAEKLSSLECEKAERIRKGKEIKGFMAITEKQPLAITEWDERLWITLLNTATVQCDGSIEFLFKNGTVIKV